MNQRFADIESVARHCDWSGSLPLVGGRSTRRVSLQSAYRALLVVVALARRAHSQDFTVSTRQLAELGAGDAGEGSRMLRALQQLGFLERLGRKQKEGTRYRLLLPPAPPLRLRRTPLPIVSDDLSTDGARRLKLRGLQIKKLMEENPKITTQEIASALDITLRTAQRDCKRVRDLPPSAFQSASTTDKLRQRHQRDRPKYNILVARQKDARQAQPQTPQPQPPPHPQPAPVPTPAPAPRRRAYRPVVPPAVAPKRQHFSARVDAIVTTVPGYHGFPTSAVDLADVVGDNGAIKISMTRVNYTKQLRDAHIQSGDRIVFSALMRKGDYETRLRYLKEVRVVPPTAGAVVPGSRPASVRARRRKKGRRAPAPRP